MNKRLILIIIGWILTALFLGMRPVQAITEPSFNTLPGDQEFLRGQNISRGETDYHDPVEATANEEAKVLLYYHNVAQNEDGQPGTSAINTRVKVAIPQDQADSHLINGSLSADNAALVDGTYVNGVEVGPHGLTINTPNIISTLEFVSGSVNWFPNSATEPQTLPFGQTGDEILTDQGLKLGDIQGCWQFAGFVTFKVKIQAAGNFIVAREKAVWNETQNVNGTSTKAQSGDVLRYTLKTTNQGTMAGSSEIADDLSDILIYADITDLGGGSLQGGVISWGLVDLTPNQLVEKQFKVKIKDPLPLDGDFVITNVYGNRVDVSIVPPEIGGDQSPILQIVKQVRNKSKNGSFQNGAIVNPADVVEYRIVINNRHGSNPAKNVLIKDVLGAGLTYVPSSGRLEIAGQTKSFPAQIFSQGGYLIIDPDPSLGPIGNNDTLSLYFEANVSAGAPDDAQLANKACVSATNHNEICDEVVTLVQVPTITPDIDQPIDEAPEVEIPEGQVTSVPSQVPQITPIQVPPISIPKTGPESSLAVVFGLTSSVLTSAHFWQAKSRLKKAIFNRSKL